MIDTTLPLELDDGTPASLVLEKPDSLRVSVPKYMREADNPRDHAGAFNYCRRTGVWLGGSAERMFTLRNAVDDEADYVSDL